jgi:hypothetical protein
MVHKLAEFLDVDIVILIVKANDAQARCGPPELAPASGEHASLHGRLSWEEGDHVLENMVGEVADTVDADHRRRTLALPLRRHSVE